MGRTIIPKPDDTPTIDYKISMNFFEKENLVILSGGEPKTQTIVIVSTGTIKGNEKTRGELESALRLLEKEYEIEFDENGIAELEFEKSKLPVQYSVRLKTPQSETKDQRVCFFY